MTKGAEEHSSGGVHPKYQRLRKRSNRQHEEMLAKFGEIPSSIVPVRKAENKTTVIPYVTKYRGNYHRPADYFEAKGIPSEFTVSGKGARGGGLSQAPYNIVAFYLKFYSKPGDLVFDPFAGQGAQMQVAHHLRRRYVGYDVCKEFFDFMQSVRKELGYDENVQVFLKDSRKVHLEDEQADLVGWTSPPYWDIEDYGDDARQIGKARTYEQFLDNLGDIIEECCRVVKQGGFICFNVMDFRKGGRFYNYHGDTVELFKQRGRKYGVEQWDCHIMDWGGSFSQTFFYSLARKYIVPRRHEYTLIFRKR